MSHTSIFHSLFSVYQSRKIERSLDDASLLIVADENFSTDDISILANETNVSAISNRWDVYEAFIEKNIPCRFSDFDFTSLALQFDFCLFRIAKERPVCHHILNAMQTLLKHDGELLLGGRKNEGIKGFHQKICSTLGLAAALKKQGDIYTTTLPLNRSAVSLAFDDSNYRTLRPVHAADFFFVSKPGLYGWNKVDVGSALLMDTVIEHLSQKILRDTTVLDLGCGYGYLSIRLLTALSSGAMKGQVKIIATDNNAAALQACERNLATLAEASPHLYTVLPSDCANSFMENNAVSKKVDLILCNPPFHQGFTNSGNLTTHFLKSAASSLKSGGDAYWVVNAFIPLEKLAAEYFSDVQVMINTGRFKIVQCRR